MPAVQRRKIKKLKIPYHRQENYYMCMPATAQMILEYYGMMRKQPAIMRDMGLGQRDLPSYPDNSFFAPFFRGYGLRPMEKTSSSFTALRKYLTAGFPVIVNYLEVEDDIGHFAIAVGYDSRSEYLYLCDPWHGPRYRIRKQEFLKRWRSGDGKHRRWLLVVESGYRIKRPA